MSEKEETAGNSIKILNHKSSLPAPQTYTYPLCLKERRNNKFIEMDCPEKSIETSSILPKINVVNPTEPTIDEDSGDLFTEEDLESETFKCKANLSFKVACNTCWCDSAGEGPKYCTRVACNPKTYKPLTQQEIDSEE